MVVKNNTITDFRDTAVDVEAGAVVTISDNTISTTANDVSDVTGIAVEPSATTAARGKISGNTLSLTGSSDQTSSFAIFVHGTSPFVISGNTTVNFRVGILVRTECQNIDGTQVTRNRLTDSTAGIAVLVDAAGDCPLVHADDCRITGNKVVDTMTPGLVGILLEAVASDTNHAFIRNAVVKGNTVVNFENGVAPVSGTNGVVDGVFEPNKVVVE